MECPRCGKNMNLTHANFHFTYGNSFDECDMNLFWNCEDCKSEFVEGVVTFENIDIDDITVLLNVFNK